ncbi:EAL domain-containing protein (putative c-di-GMP-specific phosphodiesterase class I) [Aneurinibacillus soli]|uniref:Putative membrane protein YjcC n=1 Tax=Aneurinibacillus soli TaxID=1500254 RepID=A0A0U5AS62_9BACL|nr:EAL domain-containing protein [Aneurinibacillus soli]PYE58780.1 EAL domain-containing protein (putative c-di-GMP-specific phosphodiesterase class I) [Aneurinibacillus soli]BAU26645.1 putative membrane protein YjcC [Aneurinibacillus soli]
MSIFCDACYLTSQGYTVYFADKKLLKTLTPYLSIYGTDSWKQLNDRMYWMKESIFCTLLDYFFTQTDPSTVHAFFSDASDPLFGLESLQPIASFHAERQAEWIDTVIMNRAIRTFYQPIVHRQTEGTVDIIGYELLSRGVDIKGDIIPPAQMFEAARTRDKLFALDQLCRLEAVKNSRMITDKLLFINFLPSAIYRPDHCLSSTFELVQQTGAKPENIIFEVVESEEIKNMEHLKSILQSYREHGFKYALDDVGTGYNSLRVLSELEPDIVKLALEFARGVSHDAGKQRVARSVAQMATDMGAVPLAEGIETEEDFLFLSSIGYEMFQGYYFGKPEPEPLSSL